MGFTKESVNVESIVLESMTVNVKQFILATCDKLIRDVEIAHPHGRLDKDLANATLQSMKGRIETLQAFARAVN